MKSNRTCPYCRSELEASPRTCPHCGAPLDPPTPASPHTSSAYSYHPVPDKAQNQSRTLSIVALCLAVAGLFFLWIVEIAALVTGIIARKKEPRGRKIAGAAIGISIVGIISWIIIQVVIFTC